MGNKKVNVADTRLPNVGFRSGSRFLAVSLQVTWVINPEVGCHYFPPGLQLPSQPTVKRAATNFAAWWTEARWVCTVCLRLLQDSITAAIWTQAPESSTLTYWATLSNGKCRWIFLFCIVQPHLLVGRTLRPNPILPMCSSITTVLLYDAQVVFHYKTRYPITFTHRSAVSDNTSLR